MTRQQACVWQHGVTREGRAGDTAAAGQSVRAAENRSISHSWNDSRLMQ